MDKCIPQITLSQGERPGNSTFNRVPEDFSSNRQSKLFLRGLRNFCAGRPRLLDVFKIYCTGFNQRTDTVPFVFVKGGIDPTTGFKADAGLFFKGQIFEVLRSSKHRLTEN